MSETKDYTTTLKERDKPMPVKQYCFKTISHEPLDLCPICGAALVCEYPFCPKCGQRCDRQNIAF